jgi:anhydro-N-acetylmuramic acid kinase
MDGWIHRHQGKEYDADGAWAASGKVIPDLLAELLKEPYLALPAPKSTGRDLYHLDWLDTRLAVLAPAAPEDVQRTLTQYTAVTLADAIKAHGGGADAVYICGGGAYNSVLMEALGAELGKQVLVASTQALGVAPNRVEALAFAWLGYRFSERLAGNLPAVTGARGERVLGALYPR